AKPPEDTEEGLLVGAQGEGRSELVRIGPRPPTPPTPTRGKRRWILLAAFGVVVVAALAILARASFDTDDPVLRAQQVARRAAGNGSDEHAPERRMAPASAPSARSAPAPAAPQPANSATEPQATAEPSPALAVGAAPAAAPAPSTHAHASRSRETHAASATTGAAGARGTAAKDDDIDGAGGISGTKKPDQKMAMAVDLAKKDGTWQRPPFGEDANSRLVARFTPTGGANLKGRVIEADSGKPSSGVNVEAHVGDAFM